MLPTMEEVKEPSLWITRVGPPQLATG
jgi:hypothetical protein